MINLLMTWHQNTFVNWHPLQINPKTQVIQSDTIAGPCLSAQVKCDCVFSVPAPTLWNRLSADIRKASSLEFF